MIDECSVVGIDPGFGGGVAALTLAGQPILSAPMPVIRAQGKRGIDVPALADLLAACGEVRLVVVERVGPMPKQGLVSTFNFGRGFGEVLGLVKAMRLPLEMPLPQAWKKVVLAGTAGDKAAAVAYAAARFPSLSLLPTPRCKVPSDGIADALCLAEWGRRVVTGNR